MVARKPLPGEDLSGPVSNLGSSSRTKGIRRDADGRPLGRSILGSAEIFEEVEAMEAGDSMDSIDSTAEQQSSDHAGTARKTPSPTPSSHHRPASRHVDPAVERQKYLDHLTRTMSKVCVCARVVDLWFGLVWFGLARLFVCFAPAKPVGWFIPHVSPGGFQSEGLAVMYGKLHTIPPPSHPKVGEIRAEETRREAELLNLLPVDERYNMNREAQVEQVTIITFGLIFASWFFNSMPTYVVCFEIWHLGDGPLERTAARLEAVATEHRPEAQFKSVADDDE